MRLAFCLFKFYPFGGLERDFLRVAKACQARGHTIDVYVMSWEGDIPHAFEVNQVKVKHLSNHGRCYSYAKKVKPILEEKEYDLVIGFNRIKGLDVYFSGDICYKELAKQKHGRLFKLSSRYRKYTSLEHAVFCPNGKTKILYLNDKTKQEYQTHYKTGSDRFHFVPPGIKRREFSLADRKAQREVVYQKLGLAQDDKLVLMIGSDFKRKGVDRSIHALATLDKTIKEKAKLFIVGKGKPAKYKKLASQLGVDKQVTFLGVRDDVIELLLAADLLIHPAYFETAGMVLLEAMTAGTPVIVTGNCGYAYHIDQADAGLVLPVPFHQQNLNNALHTMLKNDNEAYTRNALNYCAREDLYSLTDKTAQLIEEFALQKQALLAS